MIRNCRTGSFYIGQSTNIKKRWSKHKSALNGNYHINESLQEEWDTYSFHSFEFVILELCDIEELLICERKWVNLIHALDSLNKKIPLPIRRDSRKSELTKSFTLYLTEKQGEFLNWLSYWKGKTKSDIVRDLIKEKMAQEPKFKRRENNAQNRNLYD